VRYPVGSLLIGYYADSSKRFFRVTGHTSKKIKVKQLIPYRYPDYKERVDGTCKYDHRFNEGLVTIRKDCTLIHRSFILTKWESDDYDERLL
jgi:hypothetical protein